MEAPLTPPPPFPKKPKKNAANKSTSVLDIVSTTYRSARVVHLYTLRTDLGQEIVYRINKKNRQAGGDENKRQKQQPPPRQPPQQPPQQPEKRLDKRERYIRGTLGELLTTAVLLDVLLYRHRHDDSNSVVCDGIAVDDLNAYLPVLLQRADVHATIQDLACMITLLKCADLFASSAIPWQERRAVNAIANCTELMAALQMHVAPRSGRGTRRRHPEPYESLWLPSGPADATTM
jgi:hypothetical protein